MAVVVLKAAEQLGINIPEELSLIGYDGIQLCQLTSPEITTMVQPICLENCSTAFIENDRRKTNTKAA